MNSGRLPSPHVHQIIDVGKSRIVDEKSEAERVKL